MEDEPLDDEELVEDVRRLLERAGVPSRDLSLPRAEQLRVDASARVALERILDERDRTPKRRRRWKSTSIAVAVAASVAMIAVLVFGGLPRQGDSAAAATPPLLGFSLSDGGLALAGEDAFQPLSDLADLAGRAAQPGPGQVQQVRTAGWLLTTDPATGKAEAASELVPTRADHFTFPDGTVRLIEHRAEPIDPSARLTGLEELGEVADETFPSDRSADYPLSLSIDPQQLVSQLVPDQAECPSLANCLVGQVQNLYYSYVLTPQLCQALWDVLASVSLTYLGETKDRLNRQAVAFAAPGVSADRQVIIYADPATGGFLGSEEVLVADDADLGLSAPAVLSFTAVLDSERIALESVPQ